MFLPLFFLVLLPFILQFKFGVYYNLFWVQFATDRPTLIGSILVINLLLACFGWIAFSPGYRVAWACLCLIVAMTFAQGFAMRSFYAVTNDSWSLDYSAKVGNAILCFLIPLFVLLWKPKQMDTFVRVGFVLIGVVVTVICLYAFVRYQCFGVGKGGIQPVDTYGVYGDAIRLSGLQSNPNVTAATLLIVWPALLGRYPFRSQNLWLRTIIYFVIATVIFVVLQTYTRSGYVGLLAQLILLSYVALKIGHHSSRIKAKWLFLFLLIFLLVIGYFCEPIGRRFTRLILDPTDGSITNRFRIYQTLVAFLWERPLCGWGTDMFRVLYYGFARLPGISFVYGGAHSALLLFMFQSGIIGFILLLLAVFGVKIKQTFVNVPLWLRLSIIGVIPYLLVENPMSPNSISIIILILLVAALTVNYGCRLERHCRVSKIIRYGLPGLVFVWIVFACLSPLDPIKRLDLKLEQNLRRLRGDVNAIVVDLGTGKGWGYKADCASPSILSGIAMPVYAALTNRADDEALLSGFRIAPGASEFVGQPAQRRDLAALALSRPTKETINYLLQSIDDSELSATAKLLCGREDYYGAQMRVSCPSCETYEPRQNVDFYDSGLVDYATTSTIAETLFAFSLLTDEKTTCSDVVQSSLALPRDRAGFMRYLLDVERVIDMSCYTGTYREEVMFLRKDWEGWALAIRYQSDVKINPFIDSAANRMFAQSAWDIYCYRNIINYRLHTKEQFSHGPWFLRCGQHTWQTSIPTFDK